MPCLKPGYETIEYTRLGFGSAIQKLITTPIHWHEEIELLFCLQGSIVAFIDDRIYDLIEGEIILINSNQLHKTEAKNGHAFVQVFQIDVGYTRKYGISIEDRYFNYFSRDYNSNEWLNKKIRNCFLSYMFELIEKNQGYELILESCVDELICLLLRNIKYSNPATSSAKKQIKADQHSRLKRMIEKVEHDFRTKISLHEIAVEEDINPNYLSRYFKKYMGCPFRDFLNDYRLKKSVLMLTETKKSLTEVAYETGFADYRTFNRLFKRKYGKSPSLWKKEFLKMDKNLTFCPYIKSEKILNKQFPKDIVSPLTDPYAIKKLYLPYVENELPIPHN